MPTTTIRLSDELKSQVADLADANGTSPHNYLLEAIAEKVAALYGLTFDVEQEITVTAGATQAIFTAIAAFVRVRYRLDQR